MSDRTIMFKTKEINGIPAHKTCGKYFKRSKFLDKCNFIFPLFLHLRPPRPPPTPPVQACVFQSACVWLCRRHLPAQTGVMRLALPPPSVEAVGLRQPVIAAFACCQPLMVAAGQSHCPPVLTASHSSRSSTEKPRAVRGNLALLRAAHHQGEPLFTISAVGGAAH